MSSFDPLAAVAAQLVADAQIAMQDAALQLGVGSDVLQANVQVGDLIDALVLPPQNGFDRVSILGQTVTAQLPPGVNPGEALLLQVTGFGGQHMYVRNLGAIDPENPPQTIDVQFPLSGSESPVGAVLTTGSPAEPAAPSAPAPSAPAGSSAPPISPQNAQATVAPPREVFVAASVRPNPAAPPSSDARKAPLPPATGDLELRLAVNRTASPEIVPRGKAFREVAPPAAPRAAATARSTPPPPGLLRTMPVAPKTASQPTAQAALLARLRIPISAATLVAARLMDDAAAHVTSSYARLDEALAKSNSSDPRIATLRTLLAFVGKIDPRNARVLPEQLAAFVSHVVDGTENKLGQIVRALAQSAAEPETFTGTPPQNASFVNAAPAPLTPSGSAAHVLAAANAPLDAPPDVAAHVAERLVAMDHDVKAALLSLVQSPPRDIAAPVTQALSSALGATTALQLNVLSAQSSDPNAMSIPLPLYFFEGGKPAQLRIDRDAPQSSERMNADNFHVSFVLDTKTMGTVAIDLQTVGRAVTLNVKTERTSAADRFRGTLSDIRGRLEALRYRVAAMAADVAAPKAPLKEVPAQAVQRIVKTSNVDARA